MPCNFTWNQPKLSAPKEDSLHMAHGVPLQLQAGRNPQGHESWSPDRCSHFETSKLPTQFKPTWFCAEMGPQLGLPLLSHADCSATSVLLPFSKQNSRTADQAFATSALLPFAQSSLKPTAARCPPLLGPEPHLRQVQGLCRAPQPQAALHKPRWMQRSGDRADPSGRGDGAAGHPSEEMNPRSPYEMSRLYRTRGRSKCVKAFGDRKGLLCNGLLVDDWCDGVVFTWL